MKKYTQGAYCSPEMDIIALVAEQCIASSTGTSLDDMDNNGIYDESF